MIKFFRKIRQRLMAENRVSKYLLYSIGEIVLVVIGILIALSINNANERNKREEVELGLLKELKTSIQDENEKMTRRINENTESYENCLLLIKILEKNTTLSDSLAAYFKKGFNIWDYHMHVGAFENLKTHGMHFIKDEQIKFLLFEAYENQAEFLDRLVVRFDRFNYQTITPMMTANFRYLEYPDRKGIMLGMIPLENRLPSIRQELINTLWETSELLRQVLRSSRAVVGYFNKLEEGLTKEIDRYQ